MDDIKILEAKLLQSEAENQKLREQLHGLILLVKKAWSGDHSAAIDVALIVGVAPPTLEVSSITDEMVTVPKSPCINNWFRLTVGLINKEYKEEQTTAKAQQMLHFRNREAFIDEQMENSAYNTGLKHGEVERRASLLHDLVENENLKRNELKLKLGMLSPDTSSLKPKTRASSAKHARSTKLTNTQKMDECLIVQSRSTGAAKEGQLPLAEKRPLSEEKHKTRAGSAGRRRPGSAITASTTDKKDRPRSGIKKSNKGRIEDKLNKTENDIELTVQLLQQRLGIDERGMV